MHRGSASPRLHRHLLIPVAQVEDCEPLRIPCDAPCVARPTQSEARGVRCLLTPRRSWMRRLLPSFLGMTNVGETTVADQCLQPRSPGAVLRPTSAVAPRCAATAQPSEVPRGASTPPSTGSCSPRCRRPAGALAGERSPLAGTELRTVARCLPTERGSCKASWVYSDSPAGYPSATPTSLPPSAPPPSSWRTQAAASSS